jgi:RNA polymerase sigma-70 factor (ECF subfamily)
MVPPFTRRSRDERAAAFDRLVRPHVRVLFSAACRFTGSRADAEDLVQDVLVKLYGRVADLERIEDLRPWLLRVLYREFIDGHRRQKRRQSSEVAGAREAGDQGAEVAPAADEPAFALERDRAGDHLDYALRRLGPEQRALVILHFVEGYTLEQLARVFDAPVGTLKSRVHRTRIELRRLLGMEPFPDAERV